MTASTQAPIVSQPTATAKPGGKPKTEAEARAADAALQRIAQKSAPVRRAPSATAQPTSPLTPEPAVQPSASAGVEDGADDAAVPIQTTQGLRGVSSVKYTCPLCDTVLPGSSMTDHLAVCLLSKMEEDPISASIGLLYTACANKEALEACVEIILKYLNNIIANPDDMKYRKIRQNNQFFKERVTPVLGAMELLHGAGFTDIRENDEPYLLLDGPFAAHEEHLRTALALLSAPAPIVPDLYHDPIVYHLGSSQVIPSFQVPPDFYELTADDVKHQHAAKRSAAEEAAMLRTQAMRDAASAKKRRRYIFAVVRIRFPDRFLLQGTFHAMDTVDSLYDFVTSCLGPVAAAAPFVLKSHPGNAALDRGLTLGQAGLLPAAIVNFTSDVPAPYLREDLIRSAGALA